MNDLMTLVVFAVGLYIGWKILLAALKGLSSAGQSISSSWPAFFEKVWVSVFSGVAAGLVMGLVLGGDVKLASATGLGIAGAKFVYDVFNA